MDYYTPEAVEGLLLERGAGLGVAAGTFLLSIVNAPANSYWWKARYNDRAVDSDWLRMYQSWYCSQDPDGATDLQILVYDESYWNQLHRKDDLGPIYSGYDYVYDCDTERLTGGPAPPPVEAVIEDIAYFDPTVGSYILDAPPTLPIGQKGGAGCIGRNRSDIAVYLSMDATSYDPFGNGIKLKTVGPVRISPGGSLGIYDNVTLIYPGTYTMTFELFVGEVWETRQLVDKRNRIPVAYATGEIPPLEGHLNSPFIHDSTTGKSYYSGSLPAEIPSGHEVIAGIGFMNDGQLAVLTARVELVDPEGTVRIYGVGIRELDTGEHTGVQTGTSVDLDKGGTWKIHATLKAEGTLLDEKTWNAIQASAPPSEFKGTITRKELEYSDWTRHSIPVSDVPLGEKVGILIGGTNNMATAQQMGISWEAKDPDGEVIDSYDAWEMLPYTSPGAEHQFAEIAGQFYLDKVGTYTIEIDLLMNRDSPVVVDSYSGVLCTTTTEVPPELVLLEETIYPYAYVYDGPCEQFIFTFTTIPFTPASWVAGRMAAHCEDEVRKAGGRVMEMRVYVDESLWRPWTNWRIETICTSPTVAAELGMSVGLYWLLEVYFVVLALITLIIVTYTYIIKPLTYKHKAISPELKEPMSRKSLISLIYDYEVKLERTPTPTEDLEKKSDQELRDYADELAEIIAPPEAEFPWGLIAVAGVLGLGALGVGAALAARPKEGRKE